MNSPDFQARPIREKSTELGKLFSIPKDIPVFVYVGAIGNGRGIELLLNSFSDTRVNAHLVFIGWGELVETVQSYEMKCDNIHYHPPVSHQELGKLLSGADVGLCLIENVSLRSRNP